jgi:hypothetical protein
VWSSLVGWNAPPSPHDRWTTTLVRYGLTGEEMYGHRAQLSIVRRHRRKRPPSSVGWWLMSDAGLFREKSTAG